MPHYPTRPPVHVSEEDGGIVVRFASGTVLSDAHVEALGRRLAARTGRDECSSVTLDLAQ